MYVQFSRWKDIGYYSYELDDLKVLLNLKDPKGRVPEQYKQWGQFKDNVLEPAVRQINELSDINITFQIEKKVKVFIELILPYLKLDDYKPLSHLK